MGRWADIRELTALTFALDASLGQEGRRLDLICDLLLGRTERWDKGEVPRHLSHLIGLLSRAQEDPAQAGVAARKEEWPSKFFRTAVDEMKKVLEDSAEVSRDMADYWKKLVEEAATQLPNIKEELIHDEVRRRALRSVYIAILAALYNRMEKYRRLRVRHHDDSDGWRRLPGDGDHLPQAEAAKRLKQIEKLLSEYG